MWIEQHKQAFNIMKEHLSNLPMLCQPYFNKQFYIVVDTYSIGMAGYLGQGKFENQENW